MSRRLVLRVGRLRLPVPEHLLQTVAMSARDFEYARLLLEWARTISEHKLGLEAWLETR